MYQRNVTSALSAAMTDTPVVFIGGPRQCGKSTIAKMLGQHYITLDDPTVLSAFKNDPIMMLENLPIGSVIDEVQRAGDVMLSIKKIVDEDRVPGRFILTGSANILTLPTVADSLAGRMEVHTLWPLSQGEIRGRKERFIDVIFSKSKLSNINSNLTFYELAEMMSFGGFPEVIQRSSAKRRDEWFNSYITTILQKDMQDLANIDHITHIPNLLQILANRASNLINFADVAVSTGIPLTTLRRYMALLQSMYLIIILPAWFTNLEKRVVKTPKIHFNDTGILCHLYQADVDAMMQKPHFIGRIVENFVVMELMKQGTWSDISVSFYHFRTHAGAEVDFVMESGNGTIVGIEVKTSSNVSILDFKGLKVLAAASGEKFHRGVVLYMGDQIIHFADNMIAMPMAALWEM